MLCVTFYNKKIQLQLDCINSSSITTQPAEPADSMPTILCPQYFQRNITGYHSHSLCSFLGHQRSAASFAVLKHKRLNILQAVIDNLCLQKSAKHPFHICRCAPKKEEHHFTAAPCSTDTISIYLQQTKTCPLGASSHEDWGQPALSMQSQRRTKQGKTDPPKGRGRPEKGENCIYLGPLHATAISKQA